MSTMTLILAVLMFVTRRHVFPMCWKGSSGPPTTTSLHLPLVDVARMFFHASHCSLSLSVVLIHHFSAYSFNKWRTVPQGWWVFVGGEGGNERERTKKNKSFYNPKQLCKINTFWENCWMCCWWDTRVSVHGVIEVKNPWSIIFSGGDNSVALTSWVTWLAATPEGTSSFSCLHCHPACFHH